MEYADQMIEEIKRRIEGFAKENDYIVDEKILGVVLKNGRCPCRLDYVECPCDYASGEIEKTINAIAAFSRD